MFTSEKEYRYSKYMIAKPEIDTSKWLKSPMPGALISVAVTVGEEIFPGQELAIVEAMKMQNVSMVKNVPFTVLTFSGSRFLWQKGKVW